MFFFITECPFKPNLIAIILGVIGGIVVLGVIALLIWKLVTTLHDRREFAKFEKERQQAQWNTVSCTLWYVTYRCCDKFILFLRFQSMSDFTYDNITRAL